MIKVLANPSFRGHQTHSFVAVQAALKFTIPPIMRSYPVDTEKKAISKYNKDTEQLRF